MQPKPEALVNNSFHWVAENPQKLDLAPIVLSNVQALLAALPDHSPLRRPILGYLLQGACPSCALSPTLGAKPPKLTRTSSGISEHDALRLFRISRSTYWKSLREAGSNTILTSLRYLRKRPSREGTVASGRFGDKPVVCAPAGESDGEEEEYDIGDKAGSDEARALAADAGGALRALAGAVAATSESHSMQRAATDRHTENGPSEKRVRRGSIGFLLN